MKVEQERQSAAAGFFRQAPAAIDVQNLFH
jgi:hypothetical protein